ncbi:LamG domain-containing protein [Streptomyces sp. NPDC048277]|uniref:LamG domain-containing protein n=1 Tax=Streptomyces sp. NPDC048277 TaxID=3155027 RepID=UPI0034110504
MGRARPYVFGRAAVLCALTALTVGATAATAATAVAADDLDAPQAPVVSSAEYPDDGDWHDGVGRYGTFTIDSASDDVVSYRYNWLGTSTKTLVPAEPGGAVSLRWMPEREGVAYLQVQAVDGAGNVSPRTTYYVNVQDGRPAVAHWDPERPSGAVAGTGVTLGASGPSGTDVASAAALDGTGEGYLSLDPAADTSGTFSVDAWVRPDALDGDSTAVSRSSAFTLGTAADPTSGAPVWSFTVPTRDGGTARVTGGAPERGEWAHLAGVYDAEQRTVRLYVNGTSAGTAENVVAGGGAGALRLGADGTGGHWHGLLTDVNVWDRVLVAGEAGDAARRSAQRLGYWDLDTAADGSSPAHAGGEPLALAGDAAIHTDTDDCAWNPDCTPAAYPLWGTGDLLLDGDGDYASTPTAVTPTDAGFSVTAHARVDTATADHDMTVLSQPGAHANLFTLRYVASSRTWEAVVAHEDRAGAPTTTVSAPADWAASSDEYLALVYDEKADELRLYIGGGYPAATASVTGADTWTPTGALQVGRTLTPDGGTDHLAGAIDEVHTYAGVLTPTQIDQLGIGGVDI